MDVYEKWAVIVVDVQGDFTEWANGSLAVPGADAAYVKDVEGATRVLHDMGLPIVATQDWHPTDHVSFAINHPGKKPLDIITIEGRQQVLWPQHCVQGTENARVLIDNTMFRSIVRKGRDAASESYSGFQNADGATTEMATILGTNGIEKLVIYGLATDYCVAATSVDAAQAGYRVILIEDLCRGVSPATTSAALGEMKRKGIYVVRTLDEAIDAMRREGEQTAR
jgi:nicotinamidase/pyrazinamidase